MTLPTYFQIINRKNQQLLSHLWNHIHKGDDKDSSHVPTARYSSLFSTPIFLSVSLAMDLALCRRKRQMNIVQVDTFP